MGHWALLSCPAVLGSRAARDGALLEGEVSGDSQISPLYGIETWVGAQDQVEGSSSDLCVPVRAKGPERDLRVSGSEDTGLSLRFSLWDLKVPGGFWALVESWGG